MPQRGGICTRALSRVHNATESESERARVREAGGTVRGVHRVRVRVRVKVRVRERSTPG